MGVIVRRFHSFFTVGSFVVVLGLLAFPAVAQQNRSPVELAQNAGFIGDVLVEGTQRIEPETVKSYLLLKSGDQFDASKIDGSLKSLFATGLFADVTLRRQGDALIVNVVENPVINRIAFEGNDEVDSSDLDSEVSLRPRVIYTRTKVQSDVKRILSIYRSNGRFAATVEPKVIQLPQNRIDLVFEINEGDLTEIKSIRFVGNREFSDSRLRGIVRTRETAWWRLLSSDDKYDPDRLTYDQELLRRFYLTDGFADFRVVSAVAELTPDRKDFFLTFTVEEGRRYQFGKIDIQARLRDLKKDDIAEVLEMEQGDWYDIEAVNDGITKLTDKVGELGYAFVDVRPRINRNRKDQVIDVVFEINEGPRVFVERIDITGNVRTQDRVVRRELRLIEGDAFNSAKLRRSRKRLQDLAFFETVRVKRLPGSSPDKTVLNVDVEEKSTGQLTFGAGYSTTNGILGNIGITELNFLGKGQELSLSLTLAALKSEIDLSFTEPYFLGREIRAGFDIFRVSQDLQDFSSFETDATGFGVRAGYKITEDLRQDWNYTFKLSKVSSVGSTASSLIQTAVGRSTKSMVSHTLSYDRRDSAISPTDGYVVQMKNTFAGLGGSVRYFKNTIRAAKYYPIADQWVMKFGTSGGYVVGLGKDVAVLDRFFIGGDNLRGFATRGVGPRDTLTDDGLGGEWMYTGTMQLSFPLGLPEEMGIGGRTFSDVGSSGKLSPTIASVRDITSLRMSAGMGITWKSPFGPVAIDAAIPFLKEDHDITENIRFSFGTRF